MVETIELSIVIPVFNEESVLKELYERLKRVCGDLRKPSELVFIDDGSRDRSFPILSRLREDDPQIRVVRLTRNFGQQAAVLAGFRYSRGKTVVQIDADLQNPPEEIPRLLEKLEEGYDLVTTVKKNRRDEPWRVLGGKFLLWFGQKILGNGFKLNLSSFRAMRRSVIDKIETCSERSRYMAVLVSWMAVPTAEVEVEHHDRRSGHTKYSPLILLRLVWDLVTGFSNMPLRLVTYLGLLGAALGFFLTVFLLYQRFRKYFVISL